MAVIEELLRLEENGAISFGNHKLEQKAKIEDVEYAGDLLKVKTYREITKLERNGMFVYESVPGTSVENFIETPVAVEFSVEGDVDAQLTIGLQEDQEYEIYISDAKVGEMSTGLSGKLSISVELANAGVIPVKIIQK